MSIFSLFKVAAAGSKTSKFLKGAKGVFTLLDVGDTVLDAGQLADEIARAIMGENYSPALRDLAEEVSELGIELDTKMSAIAQANTDISNLTAGINSLAAIDLDYGNRELLVIEQLEKLDQLSESLSGASPTVQDWFATLSASAVNNAPDPDQLEALKSVMGTNMAIILGNTATLGIRAAYFGYKQRQKFLQAGKPTLTRTDRFPGSVAEMKAYIAQQKTRTAIAKRHAQTAGKFLFNAGTKIITVGSFGMNIFFLVSKVKAQQEAMRELRKLRDRYQVEIPLYEQALNGVPRGDEAALQEFAEFFELDISEESTRESLHIGYNGTIQEHEALIVDLLGQEDDPTTPDEDESDGIEGAYLSMLVRFEETQLLDSDLAIIDALRASHVRYRGLKAIALDTEKSSSVRKDEGLDPIRDEFINSVSKELNTILSSLAVQIDDHNSLNTLIIIASDLVVSVEEIVAVEADIAKTEAQLQQIEDDFIRELLEEKLALLVEKRDSLQPDIESKAQFALDVISVNTERSKFRTLEEVTEALEVLVSELSPAPEQPPVLVAA